jgi:hypothetical protein
MNPPMLLELSKESKRIEGERLRVSFPAVVLMVAIAFRRICVFNSAIASRPIKAGNE